jgi:ornithine carbamoyltransferase
MDRKKHFLTLLDYSKEDLLGLIKLAQNIKASPLAYKVLDGKTLLMIFEKTSTRTRISFESATTQMGGHAIYMNTMDSKIKEGESWADTAKVFSRYVHGVVARLYRHDDLEKMAEVSTVPIINGLTDLFHPCQTLADLLTVRENVKYDLRGITIAFLGDCGYNMAHSTMIGFSKLGMNVNLVCPDKATYQPNEWVLEQAKKQAEGAINILHDPQEGVKDVDIIYTDTWYSPGQENKEQRIEDFKPYQVNSELLKFAKPRAVVMHCLPAFRGYEITDEVIDGEQSIVFPQAENRLHIQKAILAMLIGKVGLVDLE